MTNHSKPKASVCGQSGKATHVQANSINGHISRMDAGAMRTSLASVLGRTKGLVIQIARLWHNANPSHTLVIWRRKTLQKCVSFALAPKDTYSSTPAACRDGQGMCL